MNRRKMCIAFFMSLVLFVTSIPTIVLAGNTEVQVNYPEGEDLTRLTGLMISGVDEPAAGNPLDENATVTAENGMTWDIPLFWLDKEFQTVFEYKESLSPFLAFYLPAGYTFDGSVLLDDYLTRVFNAIGHVETNYDEATGITYIFGVVNVVYKSFSYGTARTGNGRYYGKTDEETAYDPEWDPDDFGDFEDEDDGSADAQTGNDGQAGSAQTNNQPAAPVPETGPSGDQEDSSPKEETRSLYEQFKDAYDGHYENIDWGKEAERFGGLDQIDWDQMAEVIGYDNLRTIYENRQSYCDYITQNGGTEEECSVMSGKIEASLEKVKPQDDVSGTVSENETAVPMSKSLPEQTGKKHENELKHPDADGKNCSDAVVKDTEDTSDGDAAPGGSSEETGSGEKKNSDGTEDIGEEAVNTEQSAEQEHSEFSDEKEEASEQAGPAADEAVVPVKENPAPKEEAPKQEKAALEEEAPKQENPAPKKEAPKQENPAPKEEAQVPEKPAHKEEASEPEQSDPADQKDSVKEEIKTSEKDTNRENN